MKRYLFLLLLLFVLPLESFASTLVESSSGSKIITIGGGNELTTGGSLASYVGPVATATMIPNNINTTASTTMMTRKAHYIRSGTTRVKFCYANWYDLATQANTFGTEQSVGNSINVTPWIEYPVGTYTELTFSSSDPGVITDGSTLCSDFLTISVPKDTLIYSWTLVAPTTGNNFPFYSTAFAGSPLWFTTPGVEKAKSGTSGVPTTPGAFSDGNSGRSGYWPVAILGDTTYETYCLIGDSRTSGVDDAEDNSYDLGNLARSIGPTRAYVNMGVSGDRMAAYYFSHTKRDALITTVGCTRIINELGTNEYNQQSITTSGWQQLQSLLTAHFYATFPTIPYTRTTMEPWTTSTDSWKTTANQTGTAYNANVTTSNDWVRTSADSVPYVELSTPVSTSIDSGIWQVNGYAQTYVFGGGHETAAGNRLIQATGNISPALLEKNSPVSVSYPSINFTGFTPSYTTGPFTSTQAAIFAKTNILTSYGMSPGVPPSTIECQVFVSSLPTTTAFPCGMGALIGIQGTTGNIGVKTGNGTQTFGTTAISTSAWHDLELDMGTQAPGGNVFYTVFLDGVQVAQFSFSTSSTQWLNNAGIVLGDANFAGNVAEVSTWNVVRHTSGFTPPIAAYTGSEANLVGLWHLNGNLTGARGPAGN